MNKGWNTTKLIAAGSLGVLYVWLALLGAVLEGVTAIPGARGFLNVFVGGMFTLCCLVIGEFGAATITGFISSVLALPLPLRGTPGFLPKIATGVIVGLVVDIVYLALKKWNKRLASLATGGATSVSMVVVQLQIGRWFGMPGIEQAAELYSSPLLIGGTILFGVIAGYLGWLVYSRIENTAVVRRIQG